MKKFPGIDPLFIASEKNRSESDNGLYASFVQSAVDNFEIFNNFKRHPVYNQVLEHVSYEDGLVFLEEIKKQTPEFLSKIDQFKDNDIIGNADIREYEIGNISPSTLRYVKVASDLKKLFGDNIGNTIAEVGIGYGGQLLVSDKVFNFTEYHLFDLPPVLSLASKYLENHILNGSYKPYTINQHPGTINYDFVISNYAFSELPSLLQRTYIKKIFSKSEKGYLIMNSGTKQSAFRKDKLSLKELKELLPPFEILPEVPSSHPANYTIVWGHNK